MMNAETHRQIRLRVQELAEQQHLTDLELAHLSGVGATVIRRMFANSGNVYLTQLVKVAEALDVATSVLIEDIPPS